MKNTPKSLIIHHEAPPSIVTGDRFNAVDQYHKDLGWGGIGYHYFIEKSGLVKQGRKDDEEGAHTIGQNTSSLGICLAGNFDLELPTPQQIKSLRMLCQEKMQQYGIPLEKVYPHRKFAKKSCYGAKLSDQWIRDVIGVVPTAPIAPTEPTIPIPPESKEEIKKQIINLVNKL